MMKIERKLMKVLFFFEKIFKSMNLVSRQRETTICSSTVFDTRFAG